MKCFASIVLICMTLLAFPAEADMTYKKYKLLEKMADAGSSEYGFGTNLLDHWLDGVVSGLTWYHADLTVSGQKELFCFPKNFAIGPKAMREIIDTYIDKSNIRMHDKFHMGRVALYALKDSFSCD